MGMGMGDGVGWGGVGGWMDPGCVTVWLCGRLGGLVAVGLCSRVAMCLCGRVSWWLCGCVVEWLWLCVVWGIVVAVWLSGCGCV